MSAFVPLFAEAAEVRLDRILSGCTTVERFHRCELTVQVSGDIKNPYDPEEVALEATFTPPSGDPVTVPGFYVQPFERVTDGGRETVRPSGEPVWKVRFTPRQAGRWSSTVTLRSPRGAQTLPGGPFLVAESSAKGFVLYDRPRGQFRFETGSPFIPIGENLAWGPSLHPLRSYEQWFRDLARQRANYIRVWLAPWGFRLETKETGVGRYDQLRAWYLDQLLDWSEAAGLYWQLCLLDHGSFSRTQDPAWHQNPYNEALGGMCRLPNDFLTDPRSRKLFKRLLRYLAERWGYSPQLVMWEFFNEADYAEFKLEDLAPWTEEMSRFLQEVDVNRRPVTTSFHKELPESIWRLPTMDVIQLHVYDEWDFVEAFTGPKIREPTARFQKPVFVGEFGWISDVMRRFDNIGLHLHEGLWASLVGGACGGALGWYWDVYVHPNHLERHLGPAEAFWRGEQLGLHVRPVELALSTPNLAGFGVGTDERMFIWLKNRAHNLNAYIAYRCEVAKRRLQTERGQAVEPLRYAPGSVRGATATVRGLGWMGRYRVEWWDPYGGRIAKRSVTRSRWGTLTVEVPEVTFDVAAKLIKLEWWERG